MCVRRAGLLRRHCGPGLVAFLLFLCTRRPSSSSTVRPLPSPFSPLPLLLFEREGLLLLVGLLPLVGRRWGTTEPVATLAAGQEKGPPQAKAGCGVCPRLQEYSRQYAQASFLPRPTGRMMILLRNHKVDVSTCFLLLLLLLLLYENTGMQIR